MATPSHLEPSELGTKEYWDSLYTTEITNHTANPSDRGTVWFDDSDAEAKLIEYLEAQTTTPDSDSPLDQATTSFLDLGCGNGSLLLALRSEGWAGRCLGVDYSAQSVALARRIASSSDTAPDVEFAEWDVLNGAYATVLAGPQAAGWDVVLDKGTFDAISLSEERDAAGRRICEGYRGRIARLVRRGGVFVVTSCNWTEEELDRWFAGGADNGGEEEEGRFVRVGKVKYPSFSFGGVQGQTISTVCYRRS